MTCSGSGAEPPLSLSAAVCVRIYSPLSSLIAPPTGRYIPMCFYAIMSACAATHTTRGASQVESERMTPRAAERNATTRATPAKTGGGPTEGHGAGEGDTTRRGAASSLFDNLFFSVGGGQGYLVFIFKGAHIYAGGEKGGTSWDKKKIPGLRKRNTKRSKSHLGFEGGPSPKRNRQGRVHHVHEESA